MEEKDTGCRELIQKKCLLHQQIFWRSAGFAVLEGQGYEFMTVYDTKVSMGEELKTCMSSYELGMELAVVVEGNGGTNDKSIWEGQIRKKKICHSPLSKT